MKIDTVTDLTMDALAPLLAASVAEGYRFVQTLWDEYQTGKTRFGGPGETLLGAYDDSRLVAIGGIHVDPYLQQASIGRIRHVYVLPDLRRSGVGRRLVAGLLAHGRAQYEFVTLRTNTAHGDGFYSALGFSREPRFAEATHWMALAAG